MDKAEFRLWRERLKALGNEKFAGIIGCEAAQVGRWGRGEEPIPRMVRLACMAAYARLEEAWDR